jgi:hypothetical protein
VRLIRLEEGDQLSGLERIAERQDGEAGGAPPDDAPASDS